MESNWRFNVWFYGLAGDQYALIARIIGGVPDILVAGKGEGATTFDLLLGGAPGQVPALIGTFAIPAAYPHYPYGIAVHPD